MPLLPDVFLIFLTLFVILSPFSVLSTSPSPPCPTLELEDGFCVDRFINIGSSRPFEGEMYCRETLGLHAHATLPHNSEEHALWSAAGLLDENALLGVTRILSGLWIATDGRPVNALYIAQLSTSHDCGEWTSGEMRGISCSGTRSSVFCRWPRNETVAEADAYFPEWANVFWNSEGSGCATCDSMPYCPSGVAGLSESQCACGSTIYVRNDGEHLCVQDLDESDTAIVAERKCRQQFHPYSHVMGVRSPEDLLYVWNQRGGLPFHIPFTTIGYEETGVFFDVGHVNNNNAYYGYDALVESEGGFPLTTKFCGYVFNASVSPPVMKLSACTSGAKTYLCSYSLNGTASSLFSSSSRWGRVTIRSTPLELPCDSTFDSYALCPLGQPWDCLANGAGAVYQDLCLWNPGGTPAVDWVGAEETCRSFGRSYTHMASLHSAEQESIAAVGRWLGLSDIHFHDRLFYTDGTAVDYGTPVTIAQNWDTSCLKGNLVEASCSVSKDPVCGTRVCDESAGGCLPEIDPWDNVEYDLASNSISCDWENLTCPNVSWIVSWECVSLGGYSVDVKGEDQKNRSVCVKRFPTSGMSSWFEAEEFCREEFRRNAHLLFVGDNSTTRDFLESVYDPTSWTNAWIGLNDLAVDSQFVFTSGEVDPSYLPIASSSGGHCGILTRSPSSWEFQIQDCETFDPGWMFCQYVISEEGKTEENLFHNVEYEPPRSIVCELWEEENECPEIYRTCFGTHFANVSSVCSNGSGVCVSFDTCVCDSHHFGDQCEESYRCFGRHWSDSLVCSNRSGDCVGNNTCVCSGGHFSGEECESPVSCFGKFWDEPGACSDVGDCRESKCVCPSGFDGGECDLFYCNGTLSNETLSVCSGRGNCTWPETCNCSRVWKGDFCEVPVSCGGLLGSSEISNPDSCSGFRGNCSGQDICECDDDHTGEFCEISVCFGRNASDLTVCSGHGNCATAGNPPVCECEERYFGSECEESVYCDGLKWDHIDVCHGNGECKFKNDTCVCDEGYGFEETFCDTPFCRNFDGGPLIPGNDSSSVCNGRGSCVNNNTCHCPGQYVGKYCDVKARCFNIEFSEIDACRRHGKCVTTDKCACFAGYGGKECQHYSCWNVSSEDADKACSGNGFCYGVDRCWCFDHHGRDCSEFVPKTLKLVKPAEADPFHFFLVYVANTADVRSIEAPIDSRVFNCCSIMQEDSFGVLPMDSMCMWLSGKDDKTSGLNFSIPHATTHPNFAKSGRFQLRLSPLTAESVYETIEVDVLLEVVEMGLRSFTGAIVGSVIGVFVLLVIVLVVLGVVIFAIVQVQVKKQKHQLAHFFSKLENFDILLSEQVAEKKAGLQRIKVNKELCVIPYADVELVRQIGTGGSGAIVYLGRWMNRTVAFKVFKINDYGSSMFELFEREVRHPNLLHIYGSSVKLPRVGIVMEYCCNGELKKFIVASVRFNRPISLATRIRMLQEIAAATAYLHKSNIIHRDLKCENVLLTKNLSCRVMDFGLSKILDMRSSASRMTKRIGTSYYMSPEVFLGLDYNTKADIFSIGIIIWEMIAQHFHPYGERIETIEVKVATDPNLRPVWDEDALEMIKDIPELESLMKSCWQHSPEDRPTADEVFKQFSTLCSFFGPIEQPEVDINEWANDEENKKKKGAAEDHHQEEEEGGEEKETDEDEKRSEEGVETEDESSTSEDGGDDALANAMRTIVKLRRKLTRAQAEIRKLRESRDDGAQQDDERPRTVE